MTRIITSDSSIFSLQMRCFYISNDYRPINRPTGADYIKDIFED